MAIDSIRETTALGLYEQLRIGKPLQQTSYVELCLATAQGPFDHLLLNMTHARRTGQLHRVVHLSEANTTGNRVETNPMLDVWLHYHRS